MNLKADKVHVESKLCQPSCMLDELPLLINLQLT